MVLNLVATEFGRGSPVLVLHGVFGSSGNWRSIAQRLGGRHRVVSVDLRNHGASPWADEMDYPAMAADVRRLIEELGLERPAVMGHSMGGKVAMTLALTTPEIIERLVVVDIAPVTYSPTLLGYVKAMRAVDPGRLTRRAEADALLKAQIPDPAVRAFLLQNLVAADGGGLRWRLNLPVIEQAMPTLVAWRDPDGCKPYEGPALFVAGALSDYMRPEHREVIGRLFPTAAIRVVEGAGHWVHAEQTEAFLEAIEGFLDASGAP